MLYIFISLTIILAIAVVLLLFKIKFLKQQIKFSRQEKEQVIKFSQGLQAHQEEQAKQKQERKAKILELLNTQPTITNNDVEKLLTVSDATATNYLDELEKENKIEQVGKIGRYVSYRLKK